MKGNMLIVAVAAAAAFAAAPATAQNARSFVSGHGSDSNPCNLATPCRTFAGAYAKTTAGGEITVLDVAGYGALTIDHAISIVNDGVGEAGVILNAAGTAITINAGATDAVALRGLTLDGGGTTDTSGIVLTSGAALTVQNCVIRHFGGFGIYFGPQAVSYLAVSNTPITDNGGHGIYISSGGSAAVAAVLNRVEMSNNNTAVFVHGGFGTGGTLDVTVFESVAAKNANAGYDVQAWGVPTTLTLVRSVAANNNYGVYADDATGSAAATIRLANSAVIGNAHGWG